MEANETAQPTFEELVRANKQNEKAHKQADKEEANREREARIAALESTRDKLLLTAAAAVERAAQRLMELDPRAKFADILPVAGEISPMSPHKTSVWMRLFIWLNWIPDETIKPRREAEEMYEVAGWYILTQNLSDYISFAVTHDGELVGFPSWEVVWFRDESLMTPIDLRSLDTEDLDQVIKGLERTEQFITLMNRSD